MDAKEKQMMQDRADALVNDWVFRPDLREQIVRVIEVTASPLHAALLVAMMARMSPNDVADLAAEIGAALK